MGLRGIDLGEGIVLFAFLETFVRCLRIILKGLYLPESTTSELMSFTNPSWSIALLVNVFLVSTSVAVSPWPAQIS